MDGRVTVAVTEFVVILGSSGFGYFSEFSASNSPMLALRSCCFRMYSLHLGPSSIQLLNKRA